jgi:hypothetical protein
MPLLHFPRVLTNLYITTTTIDLTQITHATILVVHICSYKLNSFLQHYFPFTHIFNQGRKRVIPSLQHTTKSLPLNFTPPQQSTIKTIGKERGTRGKLGLQTTLHREVDLWDMTTVSLYSSPKSVPPLSVFKSFSPIWAFLLLSSVRLIKACGAVLTMNGEKRKKKLPSLIYISHITFHSLCTSLQQHVSLHLLYHLVRITHQEILFSSAISALYMLQNLDCFLPN